MLAGRYYYIHGWSETVRPVKKPKNLESNIDLPLQILSLFGLGNALSA
jgi:hypothetical protein